MAIITIEASYRQVEFRRWSDPEVAQSCKIKNLIKKKTWLQLHAYLSLIPGSEANNKQISSINKYSNIFSFTIIQGTVWLIFFSLINLC